MTTPVFASILIVSARRREWLAECLASIARCRMPFEAEVIVVINGDEMPEISSIPERLPHRVVHCSPRTPAAARNYGLGFASGEMVCFLDDDGILPEDYFERAQQSLLAHPDADVLGGPDRTPVGARLPERAIGMALKSPLATARTRYRHGSPRAASRTVVESDESRLILCNLWIRRSLFQRGAAFDERFMRNEENVLLFSLSKARMLHDPNLFVYHRRKTRLSLMSRAIFLSGYYRARSFYLYPGSVDPVFFVPSLFDLYLIVLAWLPLPYASAPALLYLLLNPVIALGICVRERDFLAWPLVSFHQFLINVVYGAGFLVGWVPSSEDIRRLTASAFVSGSRPR